MVSLIMKVCIKMAYKKVKAKSFGIINMKDIDTMEILDKANLVVMVK